MRMLVLGGGRQGQAVIHDLAQAAAVASVTCADLDVRGLEAYLATLGSDKLTAVPVDATDQDALRRLIAGGFDAVVDLLPRQFVGAVGTAAVDVGVHLVNTNYDHDLRSLADRAEQAGVALLPEMGMDPGMDLVLCAEAVLRFDEVHGLLSYGGGIPEWSAATENPLRYKISWTWGGVLDSYDRPARLVQDGEAVEIPGDRIFDGGFRHTVDVPGLGEMEAFPNGDAVAYARRLGIEDTVKTAGRYALRWPGHGELWHALVQLGFLEQAPVPGLPGQVSPREFMRRHLEPRLQYKPDEGDVVVVRIEVEGIRSGCRSRLVFDVVDRKDTSTGLTAMSRTVGFSASIAAQMIAQGTIAARGLLSPVRHVPYAPFVAELARRGIAVREQQVDLEDG